MGHQIANLPLLRTYNITENFKFLKYKFIQANGMIFFVFFCLYWTLFKLNKEEHFTFDKSYNMTSVIDVMYFTIATQSTIGYGDISPRSKVAKIIMMIHVTTTIILIGLI